MLAAAAPSAAPDAPRRSDLRVNDSEFFMNTLLIKIARWFIVAHTRESFQACLSVAAAVV
jgi:hypothetical protein